MASFESHYEILGLEQGASLKEITSAYRKLYVFPRPEILLIDLRIWDFIPCSLSLILHSI